MNRVKRGIRRNRIARAIEHGFVSVHGWSRRSELRESAFSGMHRDRAAKKRAVRCSRNIDNERAQRWGEQSSTKGRRVIYVPPGPPWHAMVHFVPWKRAR